VGQDSVVCISTRYWMDGPSVEFRWWRDVPQPSRPTLVPTQTPALWVPGQSREWRDRGVALTTPTSSSAEVKERLELFLTSPCVPS